MAMRHSDQPVRLEIATVALETIETLERELGCSHVLAQALARRGLADPAAAREFLECAEAHRPDAFRGIGAAVELVLGHIARGSTITVHGDYDCDGVCSTAILVARCASWEPTSTGICRTARPRATGSPRRPWVG